MSLGLTGAWTAPIRIEGDREDHPLGTRRQHVGHDVAGTDPPVNQAGSDAVGRRAEVAVGQRAVAAQHLSVTEAVGRGPHDLAEHAGSLRCRGTDGNRHEDDETMSIP